MGMGQSSCCRETKLNGHTGDLFGAERGRSASTEAGDPEPVMQKQSRRLSSCVANLYWAADAEHSVSAEFLGSTSFANITRYPTQVRTFRRYEK